MPDQPKPASFPSIFITFVSIVIALALEQLLGHVTTIWDEKGISYPLVIAQGLLVFFAVAGIWMHYATLAMTSVWQPRFQDFFVPLMLLVLLYLIIILIGGSLALWMLLVAITTGLGAAGQRYNLPWTSGTRFRPRSVEGMRSILSLATVSVSSLCVAVGVWADALADYVVISVLFLLSGIGLLNSWFLFCWWKATTNDAR